MHSLIKSIVILVVLSGIESLSVDYNLYECKDVVKTNHTALQLGQCFDAKWKKYSGCSVTEFGCIISRLIKRDCTLNTAATTLIQALKSSAIKACDVEKLSNETADSYYRRVCPQLVNIPETKEVCRDFMPCNELPNQIGVFSAKYSGLAGSFHLDFKGLKCLKIEDPIATSKKIVECLDTKWAEMTRNEIELNCCNATEFGCAITKMLQNDCPGSTTLIGELREYAIKSCSFERTSAENADQYYQKVCPNRIDKQVTDGVCKKYIPCKDLPSQIGRDINPNPSDYPYPTGGPNPTESPQNNSVQNSAQILIILSIFAILLIAFY